MTDQPETLEEILSRLPRATPFFVPDEVLAIWFTPWFGAGSPNTDSLKAAEDSARRMGCTFGYDAFMQNWCFTKPPISN